MRNKHVHSTTSEIFGTRKLESLGYRVYVLFVWSLILCLAVLVEQRQTERAMASTADA